VENKGFISLSNKSKDLLCFYILNEREKAINEFVLYHYDEALEMMKTLNREELEFDFETDKVVIRDSKTNFKFRYANKDLIKWDKTLLKLPKLKSSTIEFFIESKYLFEINKICKSMKMDNIDFVFKNGKVYIKSINLSKIKEFEKELIVDKLVVNNEGDFSIKMFIDGIRDLNYQFNYNVKVDKILNLLFLSAIINIEKDGKMYNKEIPFQCVLKGKK
jgi:hypothetical protein